MNKKVAYFLILISFSFTSIAQNHSTVLERLPYYPSFNEVTTKFFKNYLLPKTEFNNSYIFAKKPDGWHILFVDLINNKKVIEDYLYWERSTFTYQTLSFPKQKSNIGIHIPKKYDTWDNNYFNKIYPYYGYVGWDYDIISEYGAKENLSDSLINSLARAYSSYSANLIGLNSGYGDPEFQFHQKFGLNSLTSGQLDKYRTVERQSIKTYKKLWKQNPRFENFVGDIYMVYSNEIMNCFLTLRYYQNETEAHKELRPDLYEPFYLNVARNYLASCDSNAIIITNGDSDTYPLIYLQEQYGFRRDVLVVNVSLLQSNQYISHLFDKIGQSDPLSVQIDKDKYRNGALDYVYIIKKIDNKQPVELKEVMEFINSSDTATKYKYEKEYITYVPSTHFQITVDKKNVLANKIVLPIDSSLIEPTMDWSINDSLVIYQNELAILDFLSASNFKRPIYFAVTVSDDNFLNLENYFQLDGWAYKVVPIKHNYQNYDYGRICTSQLYHKLFKTFKYCNLDNDSIFISNNMKLMVMQYRNIFARLTEELISENKQDSAKQVLSLCFKRFPVKRIPCDCFSLPLISCYYKLNDNTEANKLGYALIDMYSETLEKIKKTKTELSDNDHKEIKYGIYAFKELKRLAGEYNQKELEKISKSKHDRFQKYFNL
jgi:hypothetical protein